MGRANRFIALCWVILLAGCGATDTDELVGDALARPSIVFATERDHVVREGSGSLFKSTPATVTTVYDVAGGNLVAAAEDVLAQARDAGWNVAAVGAPLRGPHTADSDLSSIWAGERASTNGTARIEITFRDASFDDGEADYDRARIIVRLEA